MKKATGRASAKSRSGKRTAGKRPAGAPIWDPNDPGVLIWRQAGQPLDAILRHESYPYEAWWTEADGMAGLFAIAARYLSLVNEHLGLPPGWLADLTKPTDTVRIQLRWFAGGDDARDSYWVRRYAGLEKRSSPNSHRLLDRSAVLLAGLCYPLGRKAGKDGLFRLYGGQGLRVVAHVGATKDGAAPVAIIGVRTRLPTLPRDMRAVPLLGLVKKSGFERLATRLRKALPATFGLAHDHVVVSLGFPLEPGTQRRGAPAIVLARTAPTAEASKKKGVHDSYALVARLRTDSRGRVALEAVHKRTLVAGMADAMVYEQDPVSKNGAASFTRIPPHRAWLRLSPNRSWRVLDPERVKRFIGNLPPGAGANSVLLVDPSPSGIPDFRVTNSLLVDQPNPPSGTKEVPATSNAHVRSNEFAAVNAFSHTSELFARMRSYGISPAAYFWRVVQPIDVNYRSGIRPGMGDGRTVNAQVRWVERPQPDTNGTIELCFALGDLQSAVGRLPSNLQSAVEHSPLGVACDPRWCWHEFCHVLIAAATGELEFGFAHSAGDALAAILNDPDSKLACDVNGAAANEGGWRGVTFPWVSIPRRHDRDVRRGWAWCGPLNRPERYFTVPGVLDKRGYWTEQIMSTALFRLYRAIGGDCEQTSSGMQVPALGARRAAADYAAYLIMRAIELLGHGQVTPTTDVGCFVQAMTQADVGTSGAPAIGGYVGGSVHKVVQWAFERQGLYAIPRPGSLIAGDEEHAKVDLQIQDQRATLDGPYTPVDLLGTGWHAHQNAIKLLTPPAANAPNAITVTVQNRGRHKARNTRVEVWVAPVNGGVIPPFPDAAWQSLGSDHGDVDRATGGNPGSLDFGPFAWTPAAAHQEFAILASASCRHDRSNVDPVAGLPCASVPGPINVLVACDNNLGLLVVRTT